MRKFSETEKQYIRTLCEETRTHISYLPINLLESTLVNYRVSYTTGADTLDFQREEGNVNIDEIIDIENKALELSLLLDYLEKCGLIKYVNNNVSNGNDDVITVGIRIPENQVYISEQIDPIVTEQLTKAATHRVFVSHTLRELVQNQFKSMEDMMLDEAKKQGCLAHTAVIISIVSFVLNFCLSQCTTQHVVVDECHATNNGCSTMNMQDNAPHVAKGSTDDTLIRKTQNDSIQLKSNKNNFKTKNSKQ